MTKELNELELETLRNFYQCWKNFHKLSNTEGSSNKSIEAAIQLLVSASHAVETVQHPKIMLLDS